MEEEEEGAQKDASQDEEYVGRDPSVLTNPTEQPQNLPDRSFTRELTLATWRI